MRNFKEKILSVLVISILIFTSFKATVVYGTTDAEELKGLLDEYEENLGDLEELKEVVDVTYNDLYAANNVDDTLKEKLKEDIKAFENIDGINPLILSVLKIELNSQVNNLNDSNINDMREEISVVKEWVDAKVGTSDTDKDTNKETDKDSDKNDDKSDDESDTKKTDNNENKNQQSNNVGDETASNEKIPKAGVKNIIGVFVIITGVGIIIFMKKYRELKEIK